MEKLDRATFRKYFIDALKAAELDEVADMSNRKLDNVVAAVGDALAAGLQKKKKVVVLMHDADGRMAEMVGLELAWKKPKKGYRKGQAYERAPSPIAPVQDWEEEIEYEDGTVVIVGKRQESKADTPPSWTVKAKARKNLVETLPAAPKRKPK